MSGIREMQLKNTGIKPYQLDIISDNACSLFLPVTFAQEDNYVRMLFLADGYKLLKNESEINAAECIDIIYDVFCKMRNAMKRYIFPDEYVMDEDTVFVSGSFKDVRVIFKPADTKKKSANSFMECRQITGEDSIVKNIEVICDMLKKRCTEKATAYIEKALECIKNDNYGIENAISNLRLIKKEIYRLGIDSKEDIRLAMRMDL